MLGGAYTLVIGEDLNSLVIHGRSKERSDAAQTRGSMPGLWSVARQEPYVSATASLRREIEMHPELRKRS